MEMLPEEIGIPIFGADIGVAYEGDPVLVFGRRATIDTVDFEGDLSLCRVRFDGQSATFVVDVRDLALIPGTGG